ncbi:PREDICTED: cytochrome b561, DM13 and DOMON domain-containing protein At5g54830-like [Tarenaya hassleriana]|uniref:cytochrome b561, DM13 and DOMON domain-containing protein At5g54830-like n=1 Tax=Tarenaya hassleriana TaxID=28532 RepID=UPI00053C9425|nr:PREDICTED: cytochrome b561, DM13 and DOMON domain-containing protein At5g54830-like [Tarenaya hassleriana]
MCDRRPVFVGSFVFGFLLFFVHAGQGCSNTSSLAGFESEFSMLQHQLRGAFTIVDDCSFRVSRFDMLSGSDVRWWGALYSDFENMTNGFVISDQKLNQTLKNASFVVHLLENVTWDKIGVISVWDLPTSSDFGHALLSNVTELASSQNAESPPSGDDSVVLGGSNNSVTTKSSTMFDNCKQLSDKYRLRWSLNAEEGYVDIGLEAIAGFLSYMAFGWAKPNSTSELMLGADIVVAGFREEGFPFADDFYITKYSECSVKDGTASGVCPDAVYGGSNSVGSLTNNTKLVYGHRRDGVSFVRYRRPLNSSDNKYDLPVNPTEKMTVIWALGLIKPPDSINPYYLPQNHGGVESENYGHFSLNLSERVDECLGPLDAENKDVQDLIIADANAPLVVTAGPAVRYPNPPNPSKVLYINKKEAPLLRVERGVPVKFSIQAGHDVALYITSDFLGGNATLRNSSEKIYVGGEEAHGVPASPLELVWSPNRNTPDQVYYHSVYEQKMGWKVQVVDGGLSDMYNNSVVLDDQQVKFFWTISGDSISIAAQGEKKSGYLAIGFGGGMVNSYAYVGWFDSNGTGRVSTYWIDGQDASDVHPTNENLTYVRCKSEDGIITLEFTRPLKPSCSHSGRPECKNLIDPTTPVKVIWAMGAKWTDEQLTERNMHSVTSQRPVRVMLMRGSAEAEQDLLPVLGVHGFMMFLAWGILLPGGILAVRYLKHIKGDGWFKIHVYLQYSGLAIVLLGLLFAVAELHGLTFSSIHVKFGFAAIFLACSQPVNASLRPPKPAQGQRFTSRRLLWEYFHAIIGQSAVVLGVIALFTGMKHLGERYGAENVHGLNWALGLWIFLGAVAVVYLEYRERCRRRARNLSGSSWVLGNLDEEDDSADLINARRGFREKEDEERSGGGTMEIQLEPLARDDS